MFDLHVWHSTNAGLIIIILWYRFLLLLLLLLVKLGRLLISQLRVTQDLPSRSRSLRRDVTAAAVGRTLLVMFLAEVLDPGIKRAQPRRLSSGA